nr:MAG TPA: hypothetical protein [Caudoviricetes sp.]
MLININAHREIYGLIKLIHPYYTNTYTHYTNNTVTLHTASLTLHKLISSV